MELCCSYFFIIFVQLQTVENVEQLRALFASSDGMDILSHIGLRSIPSRADMTCKQVVLRYLTISYQHCYCRCKGNIFFYSWIDLFLCQHIFFLGCFVCHVPVLFVFLIRDLFLFFLRLCIFRSPFLASKIVMKSHIPLLMKFMVLLTHEIYFT